MVEEEDMGLSPPPRKTSKMWSDSHWEQTGDWQNEY